MDDSVNFQDFLFVRHGQTDWNLERRVQGSTDIPLNATGIEQAYAAAANLAGCEARIVVTSPLARARQTAEIITEALDLQLVVDDALIERGFGIWEGKLADELPPPSDPETPLVIADFEDAETEPMPEVFSRLQAVMARHCYMGAANTPVFVSHGGIFRALTLMLTGTALPTRNAIPYRFQYRQGWQITECGKTHAQGHDFT